MLKLTDLCIPTANSCRAGIPSILHTRNSRECLVKFRKSWWNRSGSWRSGYNRSQTSPITVNRNVINQWNLNRPRVFGEHRDQAPRICRITRKNAWPAYFSHTQPVVRWLTSQANRFLGSRPIDQPFSFTRRCFPRASPFFSPRERLIYNRSRFTGDF